MAKSRRRAPTQSIESYLDRSRLLKEVGPYLKKGLPTGCDWVGTIEFSVLHWDDGSEVKADILKGWIYKVLRLKSPIPDPLLIRYCRMFKSDEAQACAEILLNAWIQEDLKPDPNPYMHGLPGGSAIKAKGVFALVAALGGQNVVPIIDSYLKEWYGNRAGQCKALLHILAWVEDPTAIQLLIAISVKFRTKGIRKEAEILVKTLAERKGWSADELADRTVPDAGFSANGKLPVEYLVADSAETSRKFSLNLQDDLMLRVSDEDGKVLKALPSPRKDEDPESVKAAKRILSQAKKVLKQIVKRQTERLFEGMCVERTWSKNDFLTHVLGHPILGRLARRVVWFAQIDEIATYFRPLEDGSLTSVDDEPIDLPDGTPIHLAHSALLDANTVALWIEHIADYEVQLLFDQFSASKFELSMEQKDAIALIEYEGYHIRTFKLRTLATKYGYTRGPAGDGGWFNVYTKTLPTLGIEIRLEFSGHRFPEFDQDVELGPIQFMRMNNSEATSEALPLRRVPSVLLSEVSSHYAIIARAGNGAVQG